MCQSGTGPHIFRRFRLSATDRGRVFGGEFLSGTDLGTASPSASIFTRRRLRDDTSPDPMPPSSPVTTHDLRRTQRTALYGVDVMGAGVDRNDRVCGRFGLRALNNLLHQFQPFGQAAITQSAPRTVPKSCFRGSSPRLRRNPVRAMARDQSPTHRHPASRETHPPMAPPRVPKPKNRYLPGHDPSWTWSFQGSTDRSR